VLEAHGVWKCVVLKQHDFDTTRIEISARTIEKDRTDSQESNVRGKKSMLILCVVGTWMNSDNGLVNGKIEVPSNVTRISRAIKPVSQDGIPQIVYYHFGIGTQGGVVDRLISGK